MEKIIFLLFFMVNFNFAHELSFEEQDTIAPNLSYFDFAHTHDLEPLRYAIEKMENETERFINSEAMHEYTTTCTEVNVNKFMVSKLRKRNAKIQEDFESIFKYANTLPSKYDSKYHQLQNHIIKKRGVGLIVFGIGCIIAAAGGGGFGISQWMKNEEINQIKKAVYDVDENQVRMIEHLDKSDDKINEIVNSMDDNRQVFVKHRKCGVQFDKLSQQYQEYKEIQEDVHDEVKKFKMGFIDASRGIVNPDLFGEGLIQKTFEIATEKMNRLSIHEYEIVEKNLFGFYKLDISMFFEANTAKFTTIVHIPIFAPDTLMRYYKFHSVPLTLNENVIKFTPTNDLVAIDKNDYFTELNENYLRNNCRYFHTRKLWGCPDLDIISSNYKSSGSCMMSLFKNQWDSAAEFCPMEKTTKHEVVYKSDENEYTVVNPTHNNEGHLNGQIRCMDKITQKLKLKHEVQLEENSKTVIPIPEGCQLDVGGSHVLPSENFNIQVTAPTYDESTLNIKKLIPEDIFHLMNDNAHPLNLNSHIAKISHGHYDKVHIDFHSNMITYIAVTVVVTIIVILVLVVVVFCLYKRMSCCQRNDLINKK